MNPLTYAQTHHDKFLEELRAFLRIPSVSTQAEHKADIERAAACCATHCWSGVPRAE